MAKKIFISHASDDKDVISLFKDLILNNGLGVSDEDIAFTSVSETGVPLGMSIPDYIKENISSCDFVFFMISDKYRKSEVCLNEMGAAWALNKRILPLLLNNEPFESIGWLYDKNLCTNINNSERLDEIRDEFTAKYGHSEKTSVWNKYKSKFIKAIDQNIDQDNNVPDIINESEEGTEFGILDYRIKFDECIKEFVDKLGHVTNAFLDLSRKTRITFRELNNISGQHFIPMQAKTKISEYSKEMHKLSKVIEVVLPTLHQNFEGIIENLLRIQNFPEIEETTINYNKLAFQDLLTTIESAKDAGIKCRKSLNSLPKFEQSLIAARKRLSDNLSKYINFYQSSYDQIRDQLDI